MQTFKKDDDDYDDDDDIYIHDDGSPEEKLFIDDVRKETDRRIPPDYAWVCSRPSITWICNRPSIPWIFSSLDMGGGLIKHGIFDFYQPQECAI